MAGTDFTSMHSQLSVAMYNDDTTTVEELLGHGFDVNSTNAGHQRDTTYDSFIFGEKQLC